MKKAFKKAGSGTCAIVLLIVMIISSFTAVAVTIDTEKENRNSTGTAITTGTVSASDDENSTKEESPKDYYVLGRLNFSWTKDSKEHKFTYVSDGIYKYEVGQTISYLSGKYTPDNYNGNEMYFFIADDNSWYGAKDTSTSHDFENYKSTVDSDQNKMELQTFDNTNSKSYLMRFTDDSDYSKNVTLWLDASDENSLKLWYTATPEIEPLAQSVTLSANVSNTMAYGKPITLKATLQDVNENLKGKDLTYTFKNSDGDIVNQTTTTDTYFSCSVTSDKEINETEEYTVEVSTKEVYEDDGKSITYGSVSSNQLSFTIVKTKIYIKKVNIDTEEFIGDFIEVTKNKVDLQLKENETYTFAIFDDIISETDDNLDYPIDNSKGKYCTISQSSLENGIVTYSVTCNNKASNPTLYISSEGIYAEAVVDIDSEPTIKENSSDKMVTYYFAECNYTDTKANEDNVAMSDPEGSYDDIDAEKHEGLRIHYWNNSAYKTDDDKISGQYEGWTDVVKKVKVNGSNSIYVNTSALAGVNFSGLHEFYVYSVELPIWATSFCYVGISDGQEADPLPARSVISNGSTTVASKALNPNRINLLFRYNECRYARAVVLDESLWDKSTMEATKNNEVNTKLFSANAVKYNIDDDSITNDDFNTELNNYYSENYEHPLFIGSFRNITSFLNNKNYKMWDNLANQIDGNKSYFASIQGLTYPTLSNSKTNAMGNGYLLGYDGSILPLFNYELLKSNSNLATSVYEDLEFPFYETTFNGITTYSYDSFTDRNRVINEDGNFQVGNYVTAKGTYGYMPFAKANENNQTVNKYGLATEFDINFYMTSTGYLQDINNNKQDISFNFAGDDDVWVYIDGVLALDLGGAHGVSSGTIDFTQMKVYYKTAADNTDSIGSRGQGVNDNFSTDANYIKTLDLREIFLASGIEFNKTDSSTEHTLQMFYMERGGGESNCSINFNLPQTTGLKVVNNVSVKNVNTGLQSDTRTAANSDYFTYSIANRVPTSEEQNVYTAQGAKELKIDGSIMNVSTPVYPVVTDDIIKRSLNGTEYVLAVKNKSGTLSTFYWDKLSVDNFYTLSDVNYILSDSYVNTDDDSTEVTGRINKNGNFNLLFNQTANFEDKIPNNTLLQIAQSDTLYTVNSGSDTTAMTAESESTRTVSSYYKTSYVIYDNDSNEVLGSSSVTTTNKSGKDIYADDNIENGVENAFYFSNYSKEDTSSSNATTVTFNNEVATGKIKVTKEVESTENTYDVKDNFYFTLELSDLFGVSSSSKEYPGLEYTVYDAETNTIVYTRTYGKAGIYFNASQYVVVEGIPVGTNYTLEEKTKAGYQFSKAVRTLLNNDNTVISQAQSKSKSVSFYVPDITESNYDTTNQIDYTNSKVDFAITFKYYDRETKNGTTAHISETPSKIDVPIDNISQYQQENAEGEQSLRLTKMIEDAAKKINVDNVIDEYTVFQSQEAAVKAISQKLDITANTTYGNEFADDLSLLNNHFDCYGRVQGAENCLTSDGEGWVTYYNGSEVLTEEEAQNTQKITSITVWLYNTLKIYKPTFNVAKESSDLSQKGDVWVSNGNSSATLTQPVYYNMRLGGSNHNTTLDAACDYLQNYGITTSYVYQIPETAETIDDLQFLYWASDKEGKNILTTDFEYGYRITNNFKAYAVYGKNAVENIGLTLTANSPDYFTDNNGNNKIRLNNIMNPYNCPTKDDNIKDVSIVYIVDYTEDNKVNALLEQGGIDSLRDKIQEIIKKYQNKSSFNQGMTFEIEGITFNNDAEITGLVYEVVPYGTQVTTGTNQVALNNKNRLQFTTTFWIDDIYSTNMYAFAAMNYKGEDGSTWIVSDNCIHYSFDENSILTSIDDPIGKVMYYTSLKEEEE